MTELANIQRWLTSIIVKPGSLTDKILLADDYYKLDNSQVIRPTNRQTQEQKIGIYARGYILRLQECMEAEFPALCNLLGEELFQTFVKAYLINLPSTSPDLYNLGEKFPAFLKASQPQNQDADDNQFDLPVDLAILERALAEAARVKGLEGKITRNLVDDHLLYLFDTTNIEPAPGLMLLELNYPLVDYVKAIYKQGEAVIPQKDTSWIAISRTNYRINFQEIELWQWTFLTALQSTNNYTQAVDSTAQQLYLPKDSLMADLFLWLPVAINCGYIYKNV